MKRRTTVKAVKLPEAKERHKEMMNNLTTGKALIISEAEKRHKKDVQRIETTLKTAPDKRKYLELEKDIVFRILKKDIDRLNDCFETMVAGQKTRYYRTGQFDWDLEQIRLIRQHYKNYLRGGNVNYAEETLTPKAEPIIDAIRFYHLEAYLTKPKATPKPTTLNYSDLWKRPEHGTTVKEIFESKGITVKGVYNPDPSRCKNPDTELLKAFYILRPLMKPHRKTAGVKCFYNEFKAPINVKDRTLTTEQSPYLDDSIKFARMFAYILPKQ